MPLVDEDDRRKIREDLDTTLVVEAAAGTGKTTELVSRIISVIRSGRATLGRIVAVTFTEKASGEMKLRLREEIERARATAPSEERARLDGALAELELAHIATIHGFAADLLREHPVDAPVDPLFEVVAEGSERRLFDEAFDTWFQRVLAVPPEGIRRILRRRPTGEGRGPRDELRYAAFALSKHRDFEAAWRRDPFDRDGAIDRVLERLRGLAEFAGRAERTDDYLNQNLLAVRHFLADLDRREQARGGRDYDGLEAELRTLSKRAPKKNSWAWTGGSRRFLGPDLLREHVLAARDGTKAELKAFLATADADLAPCLERELREVVAAYQTLKTRSGRLDFLDLLLLARDLIRDDRSVRNELQERFTHVFVDEFQDTDPLQAEILLLLAADNPAEEDWRRSHPLPGKLFIVGDPKQSIYRFRRADVTLYEEIKTLLLARGAELVHLRTSFRAVPSIQMAINAALGPVMTREEPGSLQAQYVSLEPFREELSGQPTVVALPVPRPYSDYGRITGWAVEASLPDAVGAFVEWLVGSSGWLITERGSAERVPIEGRHVCVLFRRFQGFEDVTRPYVRALEARRIPHVLVGGRSFYEREEILAVRNALAAIERPSDELAVYAALRGPLFALRDDALLFFRHRFRTLHPLRSLDDAGLAPPALREVADALAVVRRLHFGRNRRPIADTISQLLAATRAHAGIALRHAGEQALANVLRLEDLARGFETEGATSFRAFIDHLASEAEAGAAAEAPIVEEGTEGVRMMTVHRAKGLEFPVVILADPTAPLTHERPARHVDSGRGLWVESLCDCVPPELRDHWDDELLRDHEEAVRLAYVAGTRARDLLVVPAVGDEEIAGWLQVLNPVIYPQSDRRRHPTPAPSCPPFAGADCVLDRPERAERGPEYSVAPGLHVPREGTHGVVWWDPRDLTLGREHDLGLRHQRILAEDEGGEAVARGVREHSAWQMEHQARLAHGSAPSIDVQGVTEMALRAPAGEPITIEVTGGPREGRPRGRRFGALVHAILAAAELPSRDEDLIRVADSRARLLGASPAERTAAITAARAALSHPLLQRAVASGELRREAPVIVRLPDGSLAEGTLDLAFREEDGWTVVDFKTDGELAEERRRYEGQLRLYVRAVREATREPVAGVILSV